MKLPKIKVEKELLKKGKRLVVGIDEAGRGPLAGPVVAAAVWVEPSFLEKDFKNKALIRDSKTLSLRQRELVFSQLAKSSNFTFGIGEVSNQVIDRINILRASLLAMKIALDDLFSKLEKRKVFTKEFLQKEKDAICLLLDGNKKIPKISFEQKLFPRGDQNIFSIAAASICAKVCRDRIMEKIHQECPQFGFNKHRGYGTKEHLKNIKKFGLSRFHRRTFGLAKKWCRRRELNPHPGKQDTILSRARLPIPPLRR